MKIFLIKDLTQLSPIDGRNFPLHDLCFWENVCHNSDVRIICIQKDSSKLYSVFKLHENYAECLIWGDPFLGNIKNFCSTLFNHSLGLIAETLKKCLYFPLVYKHTFTGIAFSNSNAIGWQRSSSPIILAAAVNEDLVARAKIRIGSIADKRIKRFENSGASIKTAKNEESMNYISTIEQRSWKATCGQDMFSRNQAYIYESLARSEHSHVRIAMLGDKAIAYRFDYRINNIVYALKWSFDESYKKLSPGFYMLTKDLTQSWRNKNIYHIDLHGSLDNLKSSICDDDMGCERSDYAWPAGNDDVYILRSERIEHDRRQLDNMKAGRGIRYLYL
jgi:hypothetical protein